MQAFEQIIANFPKGFASALLLNGTVIALAYLLFWKIFRVRFQHWRIQVKSRVDSTQIKTELKNSILSLCVGAFFASIVMFLSLKGYTKIYTDYNDHHPFFAIAGIFILWLIDDAWFYFVHRMLHHPAIFRHVHLVHHRSVDVNPFTSLSFHWIEPFLLSVWIFPVAFLIPTYAPVLGAIQLIGLLDNVKSHLGYEFYPANFNKSPLRFFTSSTYHNMHHRKFTGNYGVHFRFWDKLLGTELVDYEREYDDVQKRKRAAQVD
jgi:Delta7-sterol 5-desaturase